MNQPKKYKKFFFSKVGRSRTRLLWKSLYFVHFEPIWAKIWPFWDLWDLLRRFVTLFLGYLDTLDAQNTWKTWFELSETSNLSQILAKKIEKNSKKLGVEKSSKKLFLLSNLKFRPYSWSSVSNTKSLKVVWRPKNVKIYDILSFSKKKSQIRSILALIDLNHWILTLFFRHFMCWAR